MKTVTKELIQTLLSVETAPCLSLYMPTHRSHPENKQDVIRFKSLVKKLEESLLLKYSDSETQKYLEPYEKISQDTEFWNNTLDGLAVFNSDELHEVVFLHQTVNELAIVADSFHTKPIRQFLQLIEHYYILGLSLNEFKMYEGTKNSITEIQLEPLIPHTITEALGDELTEKHSTVESYGGVGGDSTGMHHGHGGKSEESEIDSERFFRFVAGIVQEHFTKPTGLPLILASLPEHHSIFHKVNKNPNLLEKSISVNPTSVSKEKLLSLAWEILEPEFDNTMNKLLDRFENSRAQNKGSDVIKDVVVAAVEGRVDSLFIEADRIIAVRITNLITGNTQKRDLNNPKVDDLLDDLGELVIKMGGNVIVLPLDKMPSDTGLAAIFRY